VNTDPSSSGGSGSAVTASGTNSNAQGGSSNASTGSASTNPANGGSSNATQAGGSSSTAAHSGGTAQSSDGDGGTTTGTAKGGAAKGGATGSGTKTGTGGAKTSGAGGKSGVAGAISIAHAGSVAAGSTCGNSEKDGDETDVDCGGSCAPAARCAVGQACVTAKDCTTTTCLSKACAAPIVVVKTSGCAGGTATCTAPAGSLQAKIQVLNVSSSSLNLKGLEIRFYFTDEVGTTPVVEIFDKSISTFTLTVEPMTTPTATATHYVKAVYSAGAIVPDLNRICDRGDTNMDCADFTFSLHTKDYQGSYDPSNDYSFIPSQSVINNGNITVHQGTEIIWGTPPS
jgi:hypothetical protein